MSGTHRRARRARRATCLSATALITVATASACGSTARTASSASSATTKGGSSTSAATAPAPAALQTLKVALGSTSFAWMPMYVAEGAGLFQKEGLKVELTQTSAGQTTTAAMLAGDIDLAGVGTQATFEAAQAGEQTKIIALMTDQFTSVIFGRKSTFSKLGVTATSPIAQKAAALAKSTVGVTAIGSGSDLIFRYIMRLLGQDPSKMKIVPSGDSTPTLAAMQIGRIDATPFSPPIPQRAIADGYGEVLIDTIHGEVPQLNGMAYTAISATPNEISSHRAELVKFATALGLADQLIRSNPTQAAAAARSTFAQTPDALYTQGFNAMVAAMPAGPTIPPASIQTARTVLQSALNKTFSFDNSSIVDYTIGQDAAKQLP